MVRGREIEMASDGFLATRWAGAGHSNRVRNTRSGNPGFGIETKTGSIRRMRHHRSSSDRYGC